MLSFQPKLISVLRASADAGATNPTTTPTKKNFGYRGVRLFINLSSITGTSITFTVNAVDPISGNTVLLLASSAQSSVGLVSLLIYPGPVAVTNKVANDVLPRDFQIVASGTHTAAVYSISAEYIP